MFDFEKFFGASYELVDVIKSDDKNFVAFAYDKISKKLCVIKKRNLQSKEIYKTLKSLNETHLPEIYRLIERDGNLFVIEEHIDGRTLEDILDYRLKNFDADFAEEIFLQLCSCLEKVHDKNIIHRDLTLSNIMLTKNNLVKIIDFGIARIFKPEKNSDTEFLGTRGYAAPEQYGLFDLAQSDRRTDIFILGVTMKNFVGKNSVLEKILSKCTNLNPDLRYQNISELMRDFKRRKKFLFAKKFSVIFAATIAILIFPSRTSFEKLPVAEKVVEKNLPVEEKISAPKSDLNSELTQQLIDFMKNQPVKVEKITPPVKTAETKITPPGESRVKIFLYLNGELTQNRGPHTTAGDIVLKNFESWQRNKHGDYLFPENFSARVRIENNTAQDLITPQFSVDIGKEEILIDKPTLTTGNFVEFEIDLSGKVALNQNLHGKLTVFINSPSEEIIVGLVRHLEGKKNKPEG